MNILYEPLPEHVLVDGQEYKIYTDFRNWVMFLDMLEDEELTDSEKVSNTYDFYIEDIPKNKEKAINALMDFYLLDALKYKADESGNAKQNTKHKETFSYKYDAGLLISAFMECYKIDLLSIKYMHWWKFRLLFDGLSEETELKKVIGYRGINIADIKDKEEKARIKKIQSIYRLPQSKLNDDDIGGIFNGFM